MQENMGLVLTVRVYTDNEAAFRMARANPPPLEAALVTNLRYLQQRDPLPIVRPHPNRGPPVAIYEPTFAHFCRDGTKRREPEIPPDYYRTVGSFLVTSSGLYASELDRRNALLPFLMKLLGRSITPGTIERGCSSNGICITKVEPGGVRMIALPMLLELRNEFDCDPSVQAPFSFTRWWSENHVSDWSSLYHVLELMQDQLPPKWYGQGLCASFLLLIAGPWISVHGAILLDGD
jgi:hypothetical protein